eukprot:TRINITY_DN899_c0_g1_i10.p1 TRINITY_DN899_c0_g1~~TRINITY_DN899_c0_g1_i10.p1  ORF type:complete len:441 (+),score=92.70 TRINITY_DN899_c0_g1_i10:48-1370(+)
MIPIAVVVISSFLIGAPTAKLVDVDEALEDSLDSVQDVARSRRNTNVASVARSVGSVRMHTTEKNAARELAALRHRIAKAYAGLPSVAGRNLTNRSSVSRVALLSAALRRLANKAKIHSSLKAASEEAAQRLNPWSMTETAGMATSLTKRAALNSSAADVSGTANLSVAVDAADSGVKEVEEFDCDIGNWHTGWSQAKLNYCCRPGRKKCGPYAKPFHCHVGRLRSWSDKKKEYCCAVEKIGCSENSVAAAPATQVGAVSGATPANITPQATSPATQVGAVPGATQANMTPQATPATQLGSVPPPTSPNATQQEEEVTELKAAVEAISSELKRIDGKAVPAIPLGAVTPAAPTNMTPEAVPAIPLGAVTPAAPTNMTPEAVPAIPLGAVTPAAPTNMTPEEEQVSELKTEVKALMSQLKKMEAAPATQVGNVSSAIQPRP